MKVLAIALIVGVTGGVAVAQPSDYEREQSRREAERVQQEYDTLATALKPVPPDPGRDTASVRPPGWCTTVKPRSGYTPRGLQTALDMFRYSDEIFPAAREACDFPGTQHGIQVAGQIIMQRWINMTGLSEADATTTLAAHLDTDNFEADKTKLCSALKVSDEVEGEEKEFGKARQKLFGCHDKWPLWFDSSAWVDADLMVYLDASSAAVDDVVRAAWITSRTKAIWDTTGTYHDQYLLGYVLDQVDFRAFSPASALAQLDRDPYKGNGYARAVLVETVGRAKANVAEYEAQVKAKAGDAAWKEMLVDAPARGIDAYNKEAEKFKDALAHSNEFERTFYGPSRKAMAGCWPKLRKDFGDVIKTLKHGNANELQEAISADPIASLVFERLVTCGTVDAADKEMAGTLNRESDKIRRSRGPRMAAYYASLDALSQILADRSRFSISLDDLKKVPSYSSLRRDTHSSNAYTGGNLSGVVQSVKKTKDRVLVTFVTSKHQMMDRRCEETNHITGWGVNGEPIYSFRCKDLGMITVTDSPSPVMMAAELVGGVKAGTVMEFTVDFADPGKQKGMPTAVYADKSKKKLVNWFGFEL